jgi:hypothetical protein
VSNGPHGWGEAWGPSFTPSWNLYDKSNAENLKELERLPTECEIAFSMAVEPKEIRRLYRHPFELSTLDIDTPSALGCGYFSVRGSRLRGWDRDAGKCVLSKEADCPEGVEGDGYPHPAELRKLQSDMNVLDPKGRALGGYTFDSTHTKGAGVYPNLAA